MEFKITFRSADEVNMVLAGLSELPAKHSMALIMDVQRQAQEQAVPPAPPVPGEPVEPVPAPQQAE